MQLSKFQFKEAKIDIQTAGVKMNSYLKNKIESMVRNLIGAHPKVTGIDIYFKDTEENVTAPRTVTVRVGIPGPDVVASDSESRWKIALKNVEKKLVRQLEKRRSSADKRMLA